MVYKLFDFTKRTYYFQNFQTACEQAKNFSKRPPDSDMLELYSLYKQATHGNVTTSEY